MLNQEQKSSALVQLETMYLLLGKKWMKPIEEAISDELSKLDITLNDVKSVIENVKFRDLNHITPNSLIKMLKAKETFNYNLDNKCPICLSSGVAIIVNQNIEYGVPCTCKGGTTIYPLKYPKGFELEEEKEKKIYEWLKKNKTTFVQELANKF